MCIDQLLTFLFYGCSTVVRCVAVRCGLWLWLINRPNDGGCAVASCDMRHRGAVWAASRCGVGGWGSGARDAPMMAGVRWRVFFRF